MQDAHEFFCSLIDQVQEDVSALLRRQFSNQADQPKLETVCPTTLNFRLVSPSTNGLAAVNWMWVASILPLQNEFLSLSIET
jgi:hypothetical protein